MKEIWILGIHVTDRLNKINNVQSILTKFGCSIKTRLGLHEIENEVYSPTGIILLELIGDRNEFVKLENELLKIEGIEVKKMIFIE
jgi:hypothetical protein